MKRNSSWKAVAVLGAIGVFPARVLAGPNAPNPFVEKISPPQKPEVLVRSLCLSKSAATYATASDDGVVRVFKRFDRKPVFALKGLSTQIALAPDGSVLATYEIARRRLSPLERKEREAMSVVNHGMINGEPIDLVYGRFPQLKLWNARTGAPIETLDTDDQDLIFSPDSSILATFKDREMHIWNAHTGELKRSIGLVRQFSLVLDGKPVGSPDYLSPSSGFFAPSAAFSPDGTRVALSGTGFFVNEEKNKLRMTYKVQLWDVRSGALLNTLDFHDRGADNPVVTAFAFSPDGTTLATILANGTSGEERFLLFWNLKSQSAEFPQEPRRLPVDTPINHLAWLPDGKTLVGVSSYSYGALEITLWDVPSFEKLRTHVVPPTAFDDSPAVAFSPDASIVARVGDDGGLVTWQAQLQMQYIFLPTSNRP